MVPAKATGGKHWLRFLPDHVYCFLPLFEIDKGEIHIFKSMPDFLRDFFFCMEIKDVTADEKILASELLESANQSEEDQVNSKPSNQYDKYEKNKEDLRRVKIQYRRTNFHDYFQISNSSNKLKEKVTKSNRE